MSRVTQQRLLQDDRIRLGKSAAAVNGPLCLRSVGRIFFLAFGGVYSVVVISTSFVLPAPESVMTLFSHAHAHILFSLHAAVITDLTD